VAFHRPSFSPSFERAPHHTTIENPLRAVVHRLKSVAGFAEPALSLSDYAPAHAPCSARSHLARPLPCVDRTIGECNLITPRGLLAAYGTDYILQRLCARPRPLPLLSTPFTSPTTSFPPMAHERASRTLIKIVAFASRNFSTGFTIFFGLF